MRLHTVVWLAVFGFGAAAPGAAQVFECDATGRDDASRWVMVIEDFELGFP